MYLLMKKTKLRTKITVLSTLIIIIAVTLSGIESATTQRNLLTDQLNRTTTQISSTLSQNIDNFINSYLSVLTAAASFDELDGNDLSKQKQILSSIYKEYPRFNSLYITNSAGDMLVRSDDNQLSNVSDRDYFQSAVNENRVIISDVTIGKTSGKPTILIVVPIQNAAGKPTGVLVGSLDLTKIGEYRNESNFGKTGYAFIVDKNGLVLSHPDEQMQLDRTDISDMPIVESALSGKSGTMNYQDDNQSVFGAYTSVPSTGWGIIVRQDQTEAYSPIRSATTRTIVITVSVLFFAIILLYLFSKRMTKPLILLANNAKKLAQGDLSNAVKVRSRDEIGELAVSFEEMRNNLIRLIQQMSRSSADVMLSTQNVLISTQTADSVARQIALTTGELAKGSEEQSKNIQDTAISISAILKSIDQISDNSTVSFESSISATNLVNEGVSIVKEQNNKMIETSNAVNQVSDVILALNKKAVEIGNIVDVIREISQQTNLLSLNASIEAARAGERGKGFAVVAGEVRKLAEASQQSTQQIQKIIEDIQQTSQTAVQSAVLAKDAMLVQSKAVENTSKIFDEIIQIVRIIETQIHDISESTKEVKKESKAISNNIENISAMSEETAAGTEEVTASTEEQSASVAYILKEVEKLNSLADSLQKSTEIFKY